MKFIPILFSTPMVQAIQQGVKKRTRRTKGLEKINENPKNFKYYGNQSPFFEDKVDRNIHWFYLIDLNGKALEDFLKVKCPYGQVGDVLWVRETWQHTKYAINLSVDDENSGYVYKASENGKDWEQNTEEWKWKPSLFMPKEACRLFLKITDISVERLQDITEVESALEGAKHGRYLGLGKIGGSIREGFFELWESINGKDSVIQNPWVWVISFEKIELTYEQRQKFLG